MTKFLTPNMMGLQMLATHGGWRVRVVGAGGGCGVLAGEINIFVICVS